MERNCKKCIHHISGVCDAWNCKMETLEDYRAKVIDEFAEKIKVWYSVPFVGCETVILSIAELDKLAEQMKGGVE